MKIQSHMKQFGFNLLFAVLSIFTTHTLWAQNNYWNNPTGPYGGQINGIAFSPKGHLFAGVQFPWQFNLGGKVFYSLDNGEKWNDMSAGLPFYLENARWFAFHPDGNIFCGTSSGVFSFQENDSLWLEMSSGIPHYTMVNSIVINQYGILFIGTNNGVYRSENKAESWEKLNSGTGDYTSINSLLINSSGELFAGTNHTKLLLRSSDDGNSWVQAINGLPNSDGVKGLVIDKHDILFAGLKNGVYCSMDNGDTWERRSEGLPADSEIMSIGLSSTGELFVGFYQESIDIMWPGTGIFHSTDDGLTWLPDTLGLPADLFFQVYAGNEHGDIFLGTYNGLYCKFHNREDWTIVHTGPSSLPVLSLTQNPVTGSLFAGAGRCIYQSTDHGESWLQVRNGLETSLISPSIICSYDGTLYASAEYDYFFIAIDPPPGGIHRSRDNGLTWQKIPKHFYGAPTIAVNYYGTIWSNGYYDPYPEIEPWGRPGLFRSRSSGDNWELILDNFECLSFAFTDSKQLALGTNSNVLLSFDDGHTWNNAGLNSAIHSLVYDSEGNLFAATSSNIFRRRQNAGKWDALQTNFNPGEFNSSLIVTENNDVFAGTNAGELFHSADHGDTWEQLISDSPNQTTVNCLFKDVNNYLFAGTNNGILRTQLPIIEASQPLLVVESDSLYFETTQSLDTLFIQNKGDGNLTIRKINPTSYYGYFVEVVHRDTSFIWYIIDGDYGFEPLTPKLTLAPGDSALLIFQTADLCPVCKVSSSNGFFTDSLLLYTNDFTNYPVTIFASGEGFQSTVEHNNENNKTNSKFHLNPNYPNPFNLSTTISYELTESGFVDVSIFNVNGQVIDTLVDCQQMKGKYTIQWQAHNAASGVYFCVLRVGQLTQMVKLLRVR